MENPNHGHQPVLLAETLDLLQIEASHTIVDCTAGRGGHAQAIGERLGTNGTLVCIDTDEKNLQYAKTRLHALSCRRRFFHADFGQLAEILEIADITGVNAVLADLGVSTNQLTTEHYGLSFNVDAPLDMRLNNQSGITAAQLVNHLSEKELADILYQNADERHSRRIARALVEGRKIQPIQTTGQLAKIVRNALGRAPHGAADAATRTFQALRMAVNHEMASLSSLLDAILQIRRPAMRAVVIGFHSGEDRVIKQAMRSWQQMGYGSALTKKPITPAHAELLANPRSRSAKLRAFEFGPQ